MVHWSPDWVVEPGVVGLPISTFPANAVESKVATRSGVADIARRVRATRCFIAGRVVFELFMCVLDPTGLRRQYGHSCVIISRTNKS